MTQQTQAVQTKRTAGIADFLLSPKWSDEVQKVLPPGIMIDAMIRVARSAASDTKFANANPVSFLQALIKCARAGLYPDGREAHLMCFGKDVTAIFDVKGIVTLASRAGILVTPKLVYAKDKFQAMEDDGNGKTRVLHEVNYLQDRGELMAVYSRAVMKDGQVDYEFMTADEVDHVRKVYSKQGDKGPWKDSWGEMAKKTVIKRHSKRWDMSPEIRQAINDDDDSILSSPETTVSAPIFKATEPKQIETKAKPKEKKPEPAVSTPEPTVVANEVRALCEKDDIGEIELIKYVEDLGMSNPGDKTLEALQEPDLANIVERWDELAAGIKEARAQ